MLVPLGPQVRNSHDNSFEISTKPSMNRFVSALTRICSAGVGSPSLIFSPKERGSPLAAL